MKKLLKIIGTVFTTIFVLLYIPLVVALFLITYVSVMFLSLFNPSLYGKK